MWVYVIDEDVMVQVAGSGYGWSWSPDGTAIVHLQQETATLAPVERYVVYETGEVPELTACGGRAEDSPFPEDDLDDPLGEVRYDSASGAGSSV